jgi:hypothetical protein
MYSYVNGKMSHSHIVLKNRTYFLEMGLNLCTIGTLKHRFRIFRGDYLGLKERGINIVIKKIT